MAHWIFFIPLLLLAINTGPILGFKAAVFEHAEQSYATPSGKPLDIIKNNLEYYTIATRLASSHGVQIILFPEYGIIPDTPSREKIKTYLENIPDPNVNTINPCEKPLAYSDRPILLSLSCLAREHRMIVVANMGDIQPCEGRKGCPEDGSFHFNTNVAFDRDGKILAKYHKEHLFLEPSMNTPVGEHQDPTFQTDLGRFAMFVCFDSVYKKMAEVTYLKDVTAVLLPTMWININPLLNSIQYHQAWAYGTNATLLSCNVHLPGLGGIGSGIMKGREGALVYTFNPDGKSKLLIADLAKKERGTGSNAVIYTVSKDGIEELRNDGSAIGTECSEKLMKPAKDVYKDYRCLERDMTNFTLVKLMKSSDRIEACHNGMCCVLDYSADEIEEDFYLGVYNGSYFLAERYPFFEENCFLARCDGEGNRSCVTFPTRSNTKFYSVFLTANFSTPFIYPSVLNSEMRLMPTNEWSFDKVGKVAYIFFENSSGKEILTVGFKARAFDRDPPYVA